MMDTTYWESEQFHMLDIVRVRLSPECAYRREVTQGRRRFAIPHVPVTNGAIGTVLLTESTTHPGHRYGVGLEVLRGRVYPSTDWFAACELELVERRPSPTGGRAAGEGEGSEGGRVDGEGMRMAA